MYGKLRKSKWERIAGGQFDDLRIGGEQREAGVRQNGGTTFGYALHPVTYGLKNDYWVQLAQQLRALTASRKEKR